MNLEFYHSLLLISDNYGRCRRADGFRQVVTVVLNLVPVARIHFPRWRFRDGFGIWEKRRTDDAE